MPRFGFIRNKSETKFLSLYDLARVAAPIDFNTLTELVMIDDGVDYFDFAESVPELVANGHVIEEEGLYSITDKGRNDGSLCESDLPYSVRTKASAKIARLNAKLRRDAAVQTVILEREDGTCTLRLQLNDEGDNLLTVEMFSPSREQAQRLAASFKERPESFYNSILSTLLDKPDAAGEESAAT